MNESSSIKKTPRKGVLRFFICLLIAFLLWFYVMYTENPEYDQRYTDIRVELRGYTPSYEFDIEFPETIDAVFRGTNVDLAECKSDDIVAVINFPSELTSSGARSVTVSFEFLNDVTLTPLKEVRTTLSMQEADIREEVFTNIPVTVTGQEGSLIEGYDIKALSIPELTVRGRAEDLALIREQEFKATASLSYHLINDIRDKVKDDATHEFTVEVTVNLPAVGMTCWTTLESTVINTTLSVCNPDAELQSDAGSTEIADQAITDVQDS